MSKILTNKKETFESNANPDIESASRTSDEGEVQIVQLDIGTGTTSSPVTSSNPLPVTLSDSLVVENAISITAQNLNLAAIDTTSNIDTDYILSNISILFSTTQSRNIVLYAPNGAVLASLTGDTSLGLSFEEIDLACEANDNFRITISSTAGACLCSVTAAIKLVDVSIGSSSATQDVTSRYQTSDIDNLSNPKYVGYLAANGVWYIQQEDTTSGTFRYVAGASSYAINWTNRASLTYGYFDAIF